MNASVFVTKATDDDGAKRERRKGTYTKQDIVDNQTVLISIWDTVHEDTESLTRYINWADCLVIVYSITSKQSFSQAKELLQELSDSQKARNAHELPIVLLGNKNEMERYRQVSKLDGSALATQYACTYHEVSSAGDYEDVEHVFHETVREIRREAERHVPLKPLFIEEKSVTATDTGSANANAHGHHGARTKMTAPKAPRVVPKRTVSSFKFFNKGFKIFSQ
ncbi:ras-like protein family member 12 [Strongylocentrotus purpuratus]|uniref:small monomeric GTPase n=1 Tax=Strongylocentrotus purpuratus TaxID=7668 RepID=A0A7M7N9B1_STRPU|nr:ras-like protein family member 12 [Strongylocentrotus purpuratus]